MRLLLDSHVVLWWLFGLPVEDEALTAIESPHNTTFVSAAAVWEIEIKRAAGRLTAPDDLLDALRSAHCDLLPVLPEHGVTAGQLPRHHGDPFDRMLVAQAQLEGLTLVTRDERLGAYDVPVMPA
ncbi:MAG: type II toxin-antitoxin system VapC family toxin [Candidatus Limnocylindria bacterium]